MIVHPAWLCLTLLAAVAGDPNRLPPEETRGYARLCAEQAANLQDAQIKTDVAPDKACAVRGEGGGAMIIPANGLSAEKLDKVGEGVVPIGQLWLRKWTVAANDKVVPDDRLRIVTVKIEDKDRPMPLFLLGVRRGGKGLELIGYARDSEPLLVLPLQELEAEQQLPLELEWKRGDKETNNLNVNLLGRHQVVLAIAHQPK
jgi:hypothetical protein